MVVLLGSLTAMGPLAIDMYLPSLPAIGADLRASSAATQSTVAAFLAGMAIGQVFYGPASDRLGRRGPVLVGVAIFIVASVACALAPSVEWLLASRFVQALGACAGAVVSRAVVRDQFDHTETARMLSLMMLIMGLAPILAPLLGGVLLAFGGWELNFWFMAAFGVAVGLAAVLRLKESRSEATARQASRENPFQAYFALLRQRRLLGYALAGALNGATLFTYISSSPGLLMGTYGISTQVFPWLFGFNALGVIGAGQVNRLVLRRLTPDQVLERASLAALAFATLLALAAATGIGERWTVLPLLFLLLSSYGFMQGNTMAGALSVDPNRAGSTSALLGAASFAAGALAAAVSGAFQDASARPMAFTMLVALAGSALALRTLALPRRG
ncbi:Bcr/CflA family drug resistance efflux transporter [Phenylobacterium kunshanense]|uniref:Bcr/CflA family efflux transporter n=2 Tax=Phenylobacterium kunshanense TaxID=1445034 RepID=A0A328BG66_9CAUL|nr:multidrug effflux MFS transporter [Phenylobacterium kunshanense]RAK66492.1 Bcr/CflA family drug resistance efflux transporter [Phenylobacterium kunshanense]